MPGSERSRTVPIGGVNTFVAETGAGPDIVLLHGNPDTHEVWNDVVARLSARHRCIAPDLPGYGASKAPRDWDVSLDSQAAFVAGVLDALGLAKAHLVIHDVGGTFGLAFAAVHAERLASLTIMNTTFFRDNRWHFWAKVWRTPGLGELAMAIASRRLFIRELQRGSPRMPRDYASRAYDSYGRDTRRMVLRWYRYMDWAKVAPGWDDRMLAATRSVPKQVVWGDRDPFLVPTTADRFEATVHRLPDCGHWAMVEDPERVATLIADLIARNEPQRAQTG